MIGERLAPDVTLMDHDITYAVKAFELEIDNNENFARTRDAVRRLCHQLGELRIFVGKLGQDGHDRGQGVICQGLKAFGFDAIRGPLFTTADELVDQALASNAHVIGISTLAGSHMQAVDVVRGLRERGVYDVPVIVGGVMPPDDAETLRSTDGIVAVYGPGTSIAETIAPELLKIMEATVPRLLMRSRANASGTWFKHLRTAVPN